MDSTLNIRDIDSNTDAEIKKYFKGLRNYISFVIVGAKGYIFPKTPSTTDQMNSIYAMSVRETDIFVASFPRSGTTLTQELVWLMANNLDYATAKSKHLIERYVSLGSYFVNQQIEVSRMKEYKKIAHLNKLKRLIYSPTDLLANSSDPRFIKCHIPFSLLPPNVLDTAKFIYVARDPRDVAVSLYHLSKLLAIFEFIGDFKTFWDFFVRGLIIRSPYFEHVKEAWEMKDHPNMLFLFYEDISKDTPAAIRKVGLFLGKQYNAEQISKLTEHLKFENFKLNQSVNLDFLNDFNALLVNEEPFVRKGKTGGWCDYFDDEMTKQAEAWMNENLRDTDLRFPQP